MILDECNKYLILSDDLNLNKTNELDDLMGNTVIVVHMHYPDTFDYYKDYMDNIPSKIRVLITVSNESTKQLVMDYIKDKRNFSLVNKDNRGRDVSSWLVACRDEIIKYKFFCFIHDKKEKYIQSKLDTEQWINSQWENMLGSSNVIIGNICSLASDDEIGLLLPPLHFGNRMSTAFENTWKNNYSNTIELACKLGLKISIDKSITPMAIGTVFWCKTDALIKLLKYDWNYDDFAPEPLPNDGTISHAIERIIEFVAKDKGYSCKWVCSKKYAECLLENYHWFLYNSFSLLEKKLGLTNWDGICRYDNNASLIGSDSNNKIYIYGAGQVGSYCLLYLKSMGVHPEAFIVTKKENSILGEIPIKELSDVIIDDYSIIIVAVSIKYQKEIMDTLHNNNIPDTQIIIY